MKAHIQRVFQTGTITPFVCVLKINLKRGAQNTFENSRLSLLRKFHKKSK